MFSVSMNILNFVFIIENVLRKRISFVKMLPVIKVVVGLLHSIKYKPEVRVL